MIDIISLDSNSFNLRGGKAAINIPTYFKRDKYMDGWIKKYKDTQT